MAGSIEDFENGMTDEELAALEEEGTMANPGNGTADETAAATPPEKTNDDEEDGSQPVKKAKVADDEEDDDSKTPWHKHPRWIAQRKKQEALEAELQEQREWREKMEAQLQQRTGAEEDEELPPIPSWFIEAYGDDAELWALHVENETKREAEAEERILARLQARQQEESGREEQSLQWVDDQLAEVRENLADGEPDFEDNALLKIVTEFRPSDQEGNLDFRAAYNILQKMKPIVEAPAPKPKNGTIDKKNIAAHVIPSSSEPEDEVIASNETFQNGDKPW